MASVLRFVSCLVILTLFTSALGQTTTTGTTHAPIDPKDIVDVSLVTGSQARAAIDRPFARDANFRAATAYMQSKNLRLAPETVAQMQFTRASTKERYTLTYIPYAEPVPRREWHHLIVVAEGPKGTRVWAASAVVASDGKDVDVREDVAFTDGKPDPTKGVYKAFIKCALVSCSGAAAGCAYGGAAWVPCFCLWCGGSGIACALVEYFLP